MLIEHTIRPSVNLQTGDIILREVEKNPLTSFEFSTGRALEQHALQVVRTRDIAIREALIRLGWTPPAEARPATRGGGDTAGGACLSKAGRVADFDAGGAAHFMLRYLDTHAVSSSENLVDAAKLAGFKPHDDRAFGPIIASLARRGEIFSAGTCMRKRGNGTAGGRLWRRTRSPEN